MEEEIGVRAAEVQEFPDNVHLQAAVAPVFKQFLGPGVLLQLFEHLGARGEVDLAAIVGIGEAEVPDFGPAIEVRYSGRSDLQN